MSLSLGGLQSCARDQWSMKVGCLDISFSYPYNLALFLSCLLKRNGHLRYKTLIFRTIQTQRISAEESRKEKHSATQHPTHPFLIEKVDSTPVHTSPECYVLRRKLFPCPLLPSQGPLSFQSSRWCLQSSPMEHCCSRENCFPFTQLLPYPVLLNDHKGKGKDTFNSWMYSLVAFRAC